MVSLCLCFSSSFSVNRLSWTPRESGLVALTSGSLISYHTTTFSSADAIETSLEVLTRQMCCFKTTACPWVSSHRKWISSTMMMQNRRLVSLATTTSLTTTADELLPCVSQHQTLLDKRDANYIYICKKNKKIVKATYGKLSPFSALSSPMISNIWRKLLNYLTDILKCIQKRPCSDSSMRRRDYPKPSQCPVKTFFRYLFSSVSVAHRCHGWCEEFWSKHFTSQPFAFSYCLFTLHPVCKALHWDRAITLEKGL